MNWVLEKLSWAALTLAGLAFATGMTLAPSARADEGETPPPFCFAGLRDPVVVPRCVITSNHCTTTLPCYVTDELDPEDPSRNISCGAECKSTLPPNNEP